MILSDKSIKNKLKTGEITIAPFDESNLQPTSYDLRLGDNFMRVDDKHVGRLEGKSSLARLGLIIHTTAGFLDPGNCLRMTLEIVNLSPLPIILYPGMKIAQMAFEEVDQKVSKPYGHKSLNSKYYKDSTVAESKYYKNFNVSK